jgi:signal transduction histidine kinase
VERAGLDGDVAGCVVSSVASSVVVRLRPARRFGVWSLTLAMGGAAAVIGLVVAAGAVGPAVDAPVELRWWALAALFAVAELFVVHLPFRDSAHTFTLSEVPLVLGLFLAEPDELLVARVGGGLAALAFDRAQRRHPSKLAFNAALFGLEAAVAIGVYRLLVPLTDGGVSIGALGAAMAAALAAAPLGAVLVQAAIAMAEGRPAGRLAREAVALDVVAAATNTSLALVAVGLVWHDAHLAALVVPLCAVLLLGYRAYLSARRRHDTLELFYETARLLHGSSSFEGALEKLLQQARTAFQAEVATATLVSSGDTLYRARLREDATLSALEAVEGPPETLTLDALRYGRAYAVSPRRDTPHTLAGTAVRDAMVAPLHGENGVLGVLAVGNRLGELETFGRDELRLFETLADHAAVTLENMRLDRELTRLTELTAEHRRFEEHLRRSQKLEAVGRLAGGVAHEFNNLLTAVGGYGELLAGRLDGDDRRYAEEINRAAGRAAVLTRQLLAFGRRQLTRPIVLSLNDVIAGVDGMLRPILGRGVRLETQLAPNLVPVQADPALIEEALLHLAINARDAMPSGGVLTIRTETVEMDEPPAGAAPMPPGRYALLSVRDTGHGMDEETRARAFEPFFTTKGIGRGTGLGLAGVYGTVKQSGGFLFVDSAPEKGTRFDIYLPDACPQETHDCLQGREAAEQRPTILLVEEEQAMRRAVREMLERRRCHVLEAAGVREALSLAAGYDGSIELLVADGLAPGSASAELYELLALERPGLRTLSMSASQDDSFSAGALAERIREALVSEPLPA